MTILDVQNLSINYVTEDGAILNAVENVSFHLEQGQTLGIVGESGCGKTTVMLSLLRLLPAAGRIIQGQVIFNGIDLLGLSESEMRKIRWSKVAMVFQGAMNALNPVRTIQSQISEAITHHDDEIQGQAAHIRAGEMLELVGIPSERGRQYPHQYSGGMKQRAMIAMSLACSPVMLIADEPTTALDVMIQAQILRLLRQLQAEFNLSLILVTHDLGLVAEMCDSILVMYSGMVAEYGSCDKIFNEPKHPYTQGLLKAFPDVEHPEADLASIPGTPPRLDSLPAGCRFEPRCTHAWSLCGETQPTLIETETGHFSACHLLSGNRQR
jgi:peptide/nickel transport system ATP-binding protein